MAEKDVWLQLREHLDGLPVGFPSTNSGVELRLLRHLFTEEEAEMACHLSLFPQTAEQIAQQIGQAPENVEVLLEQMSAKGLVFNSRARGVTTYRAAWFAIGIWEHQVNRLTKEFVEDFEQFIEEGFRDEILSVGTPQLRVVPVGKSITPTMNVAPYDDVRELIKQQSKLAVAECICKKEKELLGEGCSNPREVCLVFSTGAYYYIEHELGREITQEEALEILDLAEKSSLVMSPGNAQKTFVICCCCGCCCAILANLKKMPKPSTLVASNYYVESDPELCVGCETCLDRCQMDAIAIQDDVATIDLDLCIGCGLCVTTCPEEALTLKLKDKSQVIIPPTSATELYTQIGTERLQRESS